MIKLLVLIGFSFFNHAPAVDSVGMKTVNGKIFIIHKVEEKETLFAISRRYGSSVDAILQYNATAGDGLEIGQLLKVPYTPKPSKPVDGLSHRVAPKETLFSISKIYGVTLDDLKQWNKLSDNALFVGQELVIRKKSTSGATNSLLNNRQSAVTKSVDGTHTVAEKETMYSIARQYEITMDQLKEWNNLEGNELSIGQTLVVSQDESAANKRLNASTNKNTTVTQQKKDPEKTEEPKPQIPVKPVVKEQTIKISEAVKNGDEIIQAGIAELIEGTEGNRKYLALHRTAPIGTILKVRNEMNNREVFVRVMGTLPDIALTDKLVIKISRSAYDRLGAIDARFRVEVTYYK